MQAYTLIRALNEMPDVEVAAALMNEGELARRLRNLGITVFVTDERRLGTVRIFARLRRILQGWQPDVVHTHRDKENILASLANRSGSRVPCLRTVHGASEHQSIHRKLVGRVDRWCGHALQQKIIAVSRRLGEQLANEFQREKVVVIENGVEISTLLSERTTADFRLQAPQDVHIGIVGRLVEVKRVDLFLRCAAWLQQRSSGEDRRFHVFGDGPLRPQLQALAIELAVDSRVTFHGHRPDIAACIGSLDALVMCSDHEGMPMAALEAVALGVPTVAHAVGGLPDIVPTEFLVSRHTAEGYAEGVERALLADGAAIAQKAANEVLARYSAKANAERTFGVYEQLLADG